LKQTKIPPGFSDIVPTMEKANEEILSRLSSNYPIPTYPTEIPKKEILEGEAAAVAYPLHGILKYQGIADAEAGTAFLPSMSINNSSSKTITVVKFDPALQEDNVIIDEKQAAGRDLERVQKTINFIRELCGSKTKAEVFSKNIIEKNSKGKGLGTTASASGAIALAAIHAAFGGEYSSNSRFVSSVTRYISVRGSISVIGGFSLWLSYPGINNEDSFSVQLDRNDEFSDIRLFTVPVESKTGLNSDFAHKAAPNSPFFKSWMALRKKQIFDSLNALYQKDWEKLGALAELDSILLHSITMSGSYENKIISWEPDTIKLMRIANDMRNKGIKVFFSIDTKPTPVFITNSKYETDVANYLELAKFPDFIKGKIAGPSHLLSGNELKKELNS